MDAFKTQPLPFLLATLLAAGGLVILLIAIITTLKRAPAAFMFAIVALGLGAAAIGAGFVGRSMGRSRTDAIVSAHGMSESDRQRLRTLYDTQADVNLVFGAAVGALPLLGGAITAALARRR